MFLDGFPTSRHFRTLRVLGYEGSGHTREPMPKSELLEAMGRLSTLEELGAAFRS